MGYIYEYVDDQCLYYVELMVETVGISKGHLRSIEYEKGRMSQERNCAEVCPVRKEEKEASPKKTGKKFSKIFLQRGNLGR